MKHLVIVLSLLALGGSAARQPRESNLPWGSFKGFESTEKPFPFEKIPAKIRRPFPDGQQPWPNPACGPFVRNGGFDEYQGLGPFWNMTVEGGDSKEHTYIAVDNVTAPSPGPLTWPHSFIIRTREAPTVELSQQLQFLEPGGFFECQLSLYAYVFKGVRIEIFLDDEPCAKVKGVETFGHWQTISTDEKWPVKVNRSNPILRIKTELFGQGIVVMDNILVSDAVTIVTTSCVFIPEVGGKERTTPKWIQDLRGTSIEAWLRNMGGRH